MMKIRRPNFDEFKEIIDNEHCPMKMYCDEEGYPIKVKFESWVTIDQLREFIKSLDDRVK